MKQGQSRGRVLLYLTVGAIISVGLGCSKVQKDSKKSLSENLIHTGDSHLSRSIGDSTVQYNILTQKALSEGIQAGKILDPNLVRRSKRFDFLFKEDEHFEMRDEGLISSSNPDDREILSSTGPESLIFGMPLTLLEKPMFFGSVITQVSNKENEDLGNLKLSDIAPMQVMLTAHKGDNGDLLVSVINCGADCTKASKETSLIDISVKGIDNDKNIIYLDLSSLGTALDLTIIRQDDPVLEEFKSKKSEVTTFDFSDGTLVFDVIAHLITKDADPSDHNNKEVVITNRWYLKNASSFNTQFASRKATLGVGYFMTERSNEPLIQRWDLDRKDTDEGIKYYIKHVPVEFQSAFAGAFEEWNEKLRPVLGKKILSYEFLPEEDPRNEILVTGDIRHNILEWDLLNKASYGGLGPSLAHQFTGEIFYASVLIQGPTVVNLYTKWFEVGESAARLRAAGREEEADLLLAKASLEMKEKLKSRNTRTFQMRFAKKIDLKIRSQDPSLQDPMMSKEGFELIPSGYTFQSYMPGYFHDMVAHELGHNLGLRHNFRGNLGAPDGAPTEGKVSRSIMEYLGRGYRYLDHIGEYDLMAISYGYMGTLPMHLDWYCTDEDIGDLNDSSKSAECSKDDATSDPFSFFHARLSRAINLLLARGKTTAPDWTVVEMADKLQTIFTGLGVYAMSAEATGKSWTNFFQHEGRPSQVSEVKDFVLNQIKSSLCDPSIVGEISQKSTEEARKKAQSNLEDLKMKAAEVLKPIFSEDQLNCT